MWLLKYTNEKGKDIIFNSRIKVSDPYDLNDPFEHATQLVYASREDFIARLKNGKHMMAIYQEQRARGSTDSYETLLKKASAPSFLEDHNIMPTIHQSLEGIYCALKKGQATKHFFVSSFCSESQKPADEILMWSHYSGGQKGMRFWFDSEKLDQKIGSLNEIKYVDEMPKIFAKDILLDNEKAHFETHELSLKSKSRVWDYEREYRWHVAKKSCYFDLFTRNNYVTIDIGSVKRIDFGIRCDSKIQDSVIKKIHKRHLSIELKKAFQDKREYKIHYKNL